MGFCDSSDMVVATTSPSRMSSKQQDSLFWFHFKEEFVPHLQDDPWAHTAAG